MEALDNNPELLQSEYWARVKSRQGWRERFFPWSGSASSEAGRFFLGDGVRAVVRRFGPIEIAYFGYAFPLSPIGMGTEARKIISAAVEEIRVAQRWFNRNHIFSRWDVPWSEDRWDDKTALDSGIRPSGIRVQPPDTVIVDLSAIELKKKTRYNVGLAEKRGVVVSGAAEDDLSRWYEIYLQTAVRDQIGIHRLEYYQTIFSQAREMKDLGKPAPDLKFYVARHERDLLGGIIVAHWRGRATYLYGASSNVKRNLMASYLLQWRAMNEAREAGCDTYDLFGIPPTDDPNHPMHGLYRFKTGFGGTIVHRPGCFDLNRHRIAATAFHGAERIRQWYHHSFRKRGRA